MGHIPVRDKDKIHGGLPWQSSGQDITLQCRGVGLIRGRGAKNPSCPMAKKPKLKKKKGNIVTNSINT